MMRRSLVLGLLLFLVTPAVRADVFHYNNIITGDRAMGLGGAYGGISDDASGVVYNPAGLGFALSNDISGSANAFYRKRLEYKNVIAGDSFVENSEGIFNPFFGGLQKLDHISPGLVLAFGVYSTDAELKDQDTLLQDVSLGSGTLVRYHRAANVRSSTNHFALAVAKRVTSNFSVGFGANVIKVDELVQVFQETVDSGTVAVTQADGSTANVTYYGIKEINNRTKLQANGIEPVLALQLIIGGRLSFGLTHKQATLLKDTLEIRQESLSIVADSPNTGGSPISIKSDGAPPLDGKIARSPVHQNQETAMGGWPSETRFGLAWFASPKFLYAFDAVLRGATAGKVKTYERESVLNLATGIEYYVTSSLPVRFGMFTNNDARPEIDKSKAGQDDHIDYLGGSLFLAWVQPNSQVAIGAILQRGKGEAQKLGNATVQEVEAESTTLGLSASHNF